MTGAGTTSVIGATSPIKILANIFISFIGAGILGLPYAFKEAGIVEGIIVMILVAVISVKAMMMIVDCKYHIEDILNEIPSRKSKLKTSDVKLPKVDSGDLKAPLLEDSDAECSKDTVKKQLYEVLTYGDIGYHAMGRTGRSLVDFPVIISQIGFCCAYLIFIMENGNSYFPSLSHLHWLLILLPIQFLFSLPRHLSRLAIFSIFAQVSSIFAFGVVFWFDFEHFHVARFHPKEYSLQGLPFYFAVAIYCFEGAGMILSLEQSLAQRVRHRFKHYFISTIIAVTFLYIAFGASGYLSFGPETSDIITFNLPRNLGGIDFPSIVTGCLCVSLFLTYPIMMFPVLELLEARYIQNSSTLKGNLLRLMLVATTGVIVTVVPNFGTLMALIGSSCCTLLAFILPGLFHLFIFRGQHQSLPHIWFDVFLIVLGTVGTIVGLRDAIFRMGSHGHRHITTTALPVVSSTQPTL